MATFSVTIEVGSPDRRTWREVSALVDTGATFTWLPRVLLEELGHVPTTTKPFQIAGGRIIDADLGEVPVRIGKETLTTICAFSENGDEAALGAVTLEQFLLAPGPVNQRLVPVVGLAMRSLEEHGRP